MITPKSWHKKSYWTSIR